MKISKTHYQLLDITQDNEALTNPQKYLGPNYQEVLRFWNHLDKMSVSQLIDVGEKFSNIDSLNWAKISNNTYKSCANLNIDFTMLCPFIVFCIIPENIKTDVVMAANIASGEIATNVQNPVILPLFNFG
jgi:hypothetical protein